MLFQLEPLCWFSELAAPLRLGGGREDNVPHAESRPEPPGVLRRAGHRQREGCREQVAGGGKGQEGWRGEGVG